MTVSPHPAAPWDARAENYFQKVISPFESGVEFPLRADLVEWLARWRADGTIQRRVVVDFGCGCGFALPWLAGQVGVTVGLDFSKGMLDESQHRLEAAEIQPARFDRDGGTQRLADRLKARRETDSPDTFLVNADMRDLAPLEEIADLGLVVNSIAPPSQDDVAPMFREVARCLRTGATLIAVFPSRDTMEHLFRLMDQHQVRLPEVEGRFTADGVFVDSTGFRQKYFTPDEIGEYCRAHGLDVAAMDKVEYPWEQMQRFGWGNFPDAARLWDWYAVATKR